MTEEDDDTQVYKRPWVNLSDSQIEAIYYEVVAEHRGAPMPWGQVVFAKAVQLYSIIDRLLDGNPDKKLIVDARRILPSNYKHSFERAKENT